jgi:hypothetical protein
MDTLLVRSNAVINGTLNGYNIDAIATNSAANKLDTTNGVSSGLSLGGTTIYGGAGSNDLTANTLFGLGLRGIAGGTVSVYPTAHTVGTVANLMGLSTTFTTTNATIEVRGRVAADDGGGGLFYYAPFEATNVWQTFQSGSGSFVWKRLLTGAPLNAKWFGARGDGSTDDTAALQAWATAATTGTNKPGGFLPAGTYLISSTLTVGTEGEFATSLISGAGDASIIRQVTTNTAGVKLCGAASLANLRIEALALQPATATNSIGIEFRKVHAANVTGVTVDGFQSGLRKGYLANNYVFSTAIRNNKIQRFSSWGIRLTRDTIGDGDSGNVFENNYINTRTPEYSGNNFVTAEGGIYLQSAAESIIGQNNVENMILTESAFKFEDCFTLSVISPHVEYVAFAGTNAVSVFNSIQSIVTIIGGNTYNNVISNTVASLSMFRGYGTGSTVINGHKQNVISNPGSVPFYRADLNNANHVMLMSGADSSTTTDSIYAAGGNYLLNWNNLAPVMNWNTSRAWINSGKGMIFGTDQAGNGDPLEVRGIARIHGEDNGANLWRSLSLRGAQSSYALDQPSIFTGTGGGTANTMWNSFGRLFIAGRNDAFQGGISFLTGNGTSQLERLGVSPQGVTYAADGLFGSFTYNGQEPIHDASAALEVVSTTRGLLPPRMTTTQRDAISSAAEGLVVFNTTTAQLNIRASGVWLPLLMNPMGNVEAASLSVSGNLLSDAGVFTNTLIKNGVSVPNDVETFPQTQVLTYSTTNVTLTAGGRQTYSHRLVATNNCQLTFSGVVDGDNGTIAVMPATTNITVLLASPARAAGSTAATSTGSTTLTITGTTNGWSHIAWQAFQHSDGNVRVSVNVGAY